jgi:uncharacterized protein YdhG (YjbR/CyaY superfamily)
VFLRWMQQVQTRTCTRQLNSWAEIIALSAAAPARYDQTRSSLHFTAEKPLPTALVRKRIKARINENTK